MTLMQTGYIERSPIQLYGKEIWKHFDARMKQMAELEVISPEDLGLYTVTDELELIYENLKSIVR